MKMIYWNNLTKLADNNNPFCSFFAYDENNQFYVEPIFYSKLESMLTHHPDKKEIILKKMEEIVKKNHHVVFVGNFEFPQTEVDDSYIFLELEDITNPLNIYVEDKSRGSDYGD